MAKRSKDEEEVIPVGMVLIVAGLIVIFTAAIIFLIVYLPRNHPQFLERQQFVVFPATPQPPAADVALLPETPLEGEELPFADEATLAFVRGQPERLLIPSLDLDAPVIGVGLVQVQNEGQTYYQWQVPPDYEVGWHNTSAPLGQSGNTVLNGHHNIHGEVFRYLADIEVGAEIVVYGRERPFTYTVSTVEILPERDQPLSVRIQNASWINPTDDERLTLITCWPYEDNSHRVVVVAYPADAPTHSITNVPTTEIKN